MLKPRKIIGTGQGPEPMRWGVMAILVCSFRHPGFSSFAAVGRHKPDPNGPDMRVIGGIAKSTPLVSLKGAKVRPTLDRVRESLFNQIAGDIAGSRFLDLFAGSGAIGIEALSRGAEEVVFVELNSQAQAVIYQNLAKCRFLDSESGEKKSKNWILLKSNALHALKVLAERHHRFDLVYVDPPYADDLYEETLTALARSSLLAESAQVIAEHHHKTALLENYDKLNLTKNRQMGDTCLSFYSF